MDHFISETRGPRMKRDIPEFLNGDPFNYFLLASLRPAERHLWSSLLIWFRNPIFTDHRIPFYLSTALLHKTKMRVFALGLISFL
jgi:hypothetical protein